MKTPLPPRPAEDFVVCSVAWDLDIVQRHTEAGFEHVPDAIVYRRFFQFQDFVQQHGFTVRMVATSAAQMTPATTLRRSDLTDEGFQFIRYAQPRWSRRFYKDADSDREGIFLERWLQRFHQLPTISTCTT